MDLVDPSASKEEAMQALHYCTRMEYFDIVDAILKTHFGTTKLSDLSSQCMELLTNVVKSGSLESLEMILDHVDENFLATPLTQRTFVTKLLTTAITNGKDVVCGTLIKRGGDPNGQINGTTFLHAAVAQGQENLMKALVEGGADISLKNKRGETIIFPVIMSDIFNKADLVSWLVARGVDPKDTGISGKQPIHVAAAHSSDVISRLVDLGCDVNQTDVIHKDTPLHIACCRCNGETIETLIKCGAKFNLVNNEGETPLTKLLKFATDAVNFHSKSRMNLARQLMKYGFISKQSKLWKNVKQKVGRNKVQELYKRLRLENKTVSSLQHLSRLVISDNIKPVSVRKAVHTLAIPPHLKDYLMFSDFTFGTNFS
ncbi:ankyrin repeat, PH and SEC7 domain containing protein secG-like [Saccostrea echinata]|uniref:ankyrin repeat, PH and SEC7 domain containing protein secG-like n=1 Tax=Saccostrea echinata TaxID=191078 RepID=UPI002A8354D5|nr:ankyrin repeat, PH and SEC7 domain containing protein secG-like [Saccostrea echinata]